MFYVTSETSRHASSYSDEEKSRMYDAGEYVIRVPDVTTGRWDRAAWIKWVDTCDGWRPKRAKEWGNTRNLPLIR